MAEGDVLFRSLKYPNLPIRKGAKLWRSLPVQHETLGIHGVCDTVAITSDGPVPIEHKSGRYVAGGAADLQVAAQVPCLRVMYDQPVPYGEVFAGKSRRRYTVTVDDDLVARTVAVIEDLRSLIANAELPVPVNDRRCVRCSLRPGRVPETAGRLTIDLFHPRPPGSWND